MCAYKNIDDCRIELNWNLLTHGWRETKIMLGNLYDPRKSFMHTLLSEETILKRYVLKLKNIYKEESHQTLKRNM